MILVKTCGGVWRKGWESVWGECGEVCWEVRRVGWEVWENVREV